MTKNMKWALAAGLSLSGALLFSQIAYTHCGSCGMGDDDKAAKHADVKGHGCPAVVEGAQVSVTNTDEGVSIVIKGKDAATIKKIQEAGAKMGSGGCCDHKGHGHEHHHKHSDGKKPAKKT